MKFPLALAFIAVMLPAVVSSTGSDELLRQKIVGVWWSEDNLGPLYIYGEKTYERDGSASGFIDIWTNGLRERTVFKSRWQIKDGNLISTVVFTNTPDSLPPGQDIVDKIVSIEKDKMVLIANGDGPELVRYRKTTR